MYYQVHIQNGPAAARGNEFSLLRWWPTCSTHSLRYSEQKLCLKAPYPGSEFLCGGPTHGEFSNAHGATLEALWALQERPSQQFQLLRAAILHRWVGNLRCTLPRAVKDRWPSESQVRRLYNQALARAGFNESPWRYPQVHCLPELPYSVRLADDITQQHFDTPQALSRAISAQVRQFLTYWQPVHIAYGRRFDEVLVARIRSDLKSQQLARLRALHESAAATASESKDTDKRRARVADGWPHPEELKALVWSKPLREVAKDFGVSDVAVKKACRKRGIETPPRGYWLTTDRRLSK